MRLLLWTSLTAGQLFVGTKGVHALRTTWRACYYSQRPNFSHYLLLSAFINFLCKRLGILMGIVLEKRGVDSFLSSGLCPGISPEPDYAAAATGGAPTLPLPGHCHNLPVLYFRTSESTGLLPIELLTKREHLHRQTFLFPGFKAKTETGNGQPI